MCRLSSRYERKLALAGAQRPWIVSDEAREALGNCELFQDISMQRLMEVAALVEEASLQSEERLLSEGEAARYLFVVVEGHGVAQLKLERGWLSLGLVRTGDVAGWSSLLEGQVYPASITAITAMRIARIKTSGLRLLMNLEPEVGYAVLRRLNSIFYRQYEVALKALKYS